jgi:hypothetical protein
MSLFKKSFFKSAAMLAGLMSVSFTPNALGALVDITIENKCNGILIAEVSDGNMHYTWEWINEGEKRTIPNINIPSVYSGASVSSIFNENRKAYISLKAEDFYNAPVDKKGQVAVTFVSDDSSGCGSSTNSVIYATAIK